MLVFANFGRAADGDIGFWAAVFGAKWWITGALGLGLAAAIPRWFARDELHEWVSSTWTFAQQILPLLFFGVPLWIFVAMGLGILLGNFVPELPALLDRARRLHRDLPDPAHAGATEVERLSAFRAVRDELRHRLAVVFPPP